MASLIHFMATEFQGNSIKSEKQAKSYRKSVKLLEYTCWTDLAVSIILSLLACVTTFCPPLSCTLFGLSLVCLISGAPLLKSHKSAKKLAEKRIELFHMKQRYGIL